MIQSVVDQLSNMLESLIQNNEEEKISKTLSKYFMEMS